MTRSRSGQTPARSHLRPAPAEPRPAQRAALGEERTVELRIGDFACKAMERESARMGVSVQELMKFAIVYYLADLDSGRIARRVPPVESAERED